ncbi:universal stress protein [Actinoplanes sp. LDG1-06]|uniref:Universal stress protein n=1 Tax=Paractinoplanes ovalisporus TaxID=2810368 RepID=A0ABS2A993_9ACTN|nr:universal stress protein [Actinoplanes ovalisporus]MBM2616325.1 universal stress protein [Actinoplanes ovalisporus]
MTSRPVLVGLDGADPAASALVWAVDEAQRRHAPLRIVHVLEWHPVDSSELPGHTYVEVVWASGNALVAAAARRAAEIAPQLSVRSDTLLGRPAECLTNAARDAQLVVLGHRGRGGFAGMLLGSVSERVAGHASCPVAVVRGRAAADGPVVVGVDDSPAAGPVLADAFETAAGRGSRLVVVRAGGADPAGRARLERDVAPWSEKYPQVAVEVRLVDDDAAPALVDASAGARLMVVGSRGRGPVRAALLGSTGLHLLRLAACPVLITRHR